MVGVGTWAVVYVEGGGGGRLWRRWVEKLEEG